MKRSHGYGVSVPQDEKSSGDWLHNNWMYFLRYWAVYLQMVKMVFSVTGILISVLKEKRKKKEWVLIHTMTWMNLKTLQEAKEARHKRPHIVRSHVCEMLRPGESMETKNKLEAANSWREGWMRNDCSSRQSFPLGFLGCFFVFVLPNPQHVEVPGPEIPPMPRQWQHKILNPLSHQRELQELPFGVIKKAWN